MIGWLVGQCHVGQTNMEVIRYIFSKMRKKGRKKFFAMPRKERRKIMEKLFRNTKQTVKCTVTSWEECIQERKQKYKRLYCSFSSTTLYCAYVRIKDARKAKERELK